MTTTTQIDKMNKILNEVVKISNSGKQIDLRLRDDVTSFSSEIGREIAEESLKEIPNFPRSEETYEYFLEYCRLKFFKNKELSGRIDKAYNNTNLYIFEEETLWDMVCDEMLDAYEDVWKNNKIKSPETENIFTKEM